MTLLLAYARERLTPGRVLPAALLVVLAALAGRGWSGGGALAADAVIGLALVIAFRIWDDLASLERDRARHPERVAVRAASIVAGSKDPAYSGTANGSSGLAGRVFRPGVAPLWIAAGATALAAAVLLGLTRGSASVAFLASYTIVLAGVYAGRGPRSAASDRILLLKYGVFALALMGLPDVSARGLLAAAAAFVAACVYEWWHDAESPVFSRKNGPPRVDACGRPGDSRSPIPDPRLGGSR